ncbi:hypothetical protein C478_09621 [Natrinema thermotolerans DSM 11552]|nr:hypothetical protein C478_09621 [Natrinema thermotolerans DSM 11552]
MGRDTASLAGPDDCLDGTTSFTDRQFPAASMTADERPTPPTELDRVGHEALDELATREPAALRAASAYLEELAAWKESDDEDDPSPDDGGPATYPDGVPERASVSVTEIAGTEYYYFQWRDGDEIRSETVRR